MQRATGKLEEPQHGSRHARGFVSASWAANNGKALPGDDEDPTAAPGLTHPEVTSAAMLRLCIHRAALRWSLGSQSAAACRGALAGQSQTASSRGAPAPPRMLHLSLHRAAGAGATARRLWLGRRGGAPHP
jgi:hypothetical protein